MRVIVADPVCFISLDVWFGDTSLLEAHTHSQHLDRAHRTIKRTKNVYRQSLFSRRASRLFARIPC